MLTEASTPTDIINRRLDDYAQKQPLAALFDDYRQTLQAEENAWAASRSFYIDDDAVRCELAAEARRLTQQRIAFELNLKQRLARVDRLHGGKR